MTRLCRLLAMLMLLLAASPIAHAAETIAVPADVPALDLTQVIEIRQEKSASIQVSTAPGADGIVRRIEVRSRSGEPNTIWGVISLSNTTEQQLDRLIVVPHFRLTGSRIIWPDLGTRRVTAITPSQGFAPERQSSLDADVFLITLDPGSVVTFVAELRTTDLPQVTLWEPNAYKDSVNAYTLYRGIVLGISGLLALVLTILFLVKGSMMFPATAALAWAVLAYLCIDFGFWNRLFNIPSGTDQLYRAGSEVMIAVTLVIFLYAYLNLNRWHVRYSHVAFLTLIGLATLFGVATYNPSIAAGVARMMMAGLGFFGFIVILGLALYGYDRAIMLIPTWLIYIAWLIGTAMAVSGYLVNDLVQPALSGGLVLLVLLLGFTVMQHAFTGGLIADGSMNDAERRALALTGAGDVIWDWDVASDRIFTSSEAEESLGFKRGALEGPARDWLEILHPQDRDRFKATLDAAVENRRGRLAQTLRLKARDGHYQWFRLRARPIIGNDGEVIRCVGTLLDITDAKTAQERLLHDAIHDNLTGLPNRELFMDRLGTAITRAQSDANAKPAVFLIDIDRFRQVNESVGLSVGDSILLTVARRLGRLLKPLDTLARLQGDHFGIILVSEQSPERVAAFADAVKRAIRAAIAFGEREIFLTASIGIAMLDGETLEAGDQIKDAEVAVAFAKRLGGDRIETFRPALKTTANDAQSLEADLRKALERDEIKVLYQPIVKLSDNNVSGFEALLRWDHPKRGRIPPVDFIPIAERSDLIVALGLFVLERAARQLGEWHAALPGGDKLFMSVNLSSRQLLRHDLINDVKAILSRHSLPKGTLKLELTESLVMENPEFSTQVLQRLKELGTGLTLDDFGTGFSSLAYLQRLPADTLKIDQSFLKGSGRNRTTILKSIINMAHEMGLDVVAEGAETEAEVTELRGLSADYAQGYLFGHPMLPEDVRKFVERAAKSKVKQK